MRIADCHQRICWCMQELHSAWIIPGGPVANSLHPISASAQPAYVGLSILSQLVFYMVRLFDERFQSYFTVAAVSGRKWCSRAVFAAWQMCFLDGFRRSIVDFDRRLMMLLLGQPLLVCCCTEKNDWYRARRRHPTNQDPLRNGTSSSEPSRGHIVKNDGPTQLWLLRYSNGRTIRLDELNGGLMEVWWCSERVGRG